MTILTRLYEVVEELRCICNKLDGIGGVGDGPGNMPYPAPAPGPVPDPPPVTGNDGPVTAGRPAICQAAYGFADHIKSTVYQLAQLASTQQVDPAAVGDVARTVGTNMFVQIIQSILAAIWGEVVRVLNAFGFAIGAILSNVAEDIPDDIFLCAFLNNWDGTDADPVAISAACQDAIREHLSGGQILIGLMVATFIWPEKIQAYLAGEARDDMDQPVALDLSGYPSVCGCVERYGLIQEFRGYYQNNEVNRCDHPDFMAWTTPSGDPVPNDEKFVVGERCNDESYHAGLLDSSAMTAPYLYTNGYRQEFTLEAGGDYTLYARGGRRAFPGGNASVAILNLDTSNLQSLNMDDSGAQGLYYLFLENYPAGNYRIVIYTTSSGGDHQVTELYLAPGNNPEGA